MTQPLTVHVSPECWEMLGPAPLSAELRGVIAAATRLQNGAPDPAFPYALSMSTVQALDLVQFVANAARGLSVADHRRRHWEQCLRDIEAAIRGASER